LKIHQIFVVKFLSLFIGTVIISSVISYVSLRSIIVEHNKKHLQDVISVISINLSDTKNLDLLATTVNDKTGLRVTIIDNNGVVIAESNIDKNTMDNHGQRYEIIGANSSEFSYIIRYSKTLEIDFLYVAKSFFFIIKRYILDFL